MESRPPSLPPAPASGAAADGAELDASAPSSGGSPGRSEVRRVLRRAADLAADYLERGERYPVKPRVAPGEVAARLAASPPERGEDWDAIFADYCELIEPNVTHWNQPGFLAYFAISGSLPGVAAETLTAALNVNAMLWRTAPAATELEERVCDWLRQMLELPPAFRGHINDTASISTLLALAAARHRAAPAARSEGLSGLAPMTVYCSDQAHSSVDKTMLTLGLGVERLRRLPSDREYRLRPEALAAAIDRDRAAGLVPTAVVATAGTTSTTSIDPLRAVAEVCRARGVWLHVDAAYAGSAAIRPEVRRLLDGLEEADSIVVNPHKWLFVPIDCSVLLTRGLDPLREAFSLVPEYLRTGEGEGTNLMDLGVQLGRRFRALKLWMVIRHYGVQGLRARIGRHCALAAELAGWVEAEPGFEVCAPVPLSVVCLRAVPGEARPAEEVDRFNLALLERVNEGGRVFLSHTRLREGTVLRVAIGNLETEREHVRAAFEQLRDGARALCAEWGWS
ncbi:MAG TPA: pyridoxal-dependent decarboxylase [Thermoanaerobaculia bacterium]|nr:pyridoxal-dependent decarboxylase [Thermoanaerobaculia bacterium]